MMWIFLKDDSSDLKAENLKVLKFNVEMIRINTY